jgi:phosphatidylserine/phosphatidylglycerophosphate/cardiolipin synthase-like enzyme
MAIYVHAKVMIVDDVMLRVGSSNLNNRSMRLDTECDVVLDATLPGQAHIAKTIRELRDDLAAEHLNVTAGEFASVFDGTDSLIEAVEQLRGQGRTLKPYIPPALTRLGTFLAERQLLDPDGPEQTFDPFARRSLFRRLRRPPPSG